MMIYLVICNYIIALAEIYFNLYIRIDINDRYFHRETTY
jgi:hypothetical protein